MKRIIQFGSVALLSFVLSTNAKAQSFTLDHDTVKYVVYNAVQIHNDINNISANKILVDWKVVQHNLPADWQAAIGICDNKLCYSNIIGTPGPSQKTDTINAAASSLFEVQMNAGSLSAGGPFYVSVELKEGTTTDTATFAMYKWPTSVRNVSNKGDGINLYPNPVRSQLNISFENAGVKNIVITNAIGSVVGSYNVAGRKDVKLNLENLASGAYFVKFTDDQGNTKSVRRIVHE
jgi:hypothetical protein